MTLDLFAESNVHENSVEPFSGCQRIDLPDAELFLYPNFFSNDQADGYLDTLLDEIQWQQEKISLYGKVHDVPRLSAWYGDTGLSYTYSGIRAEALPWPSSLLAIKSELERVVSTEFNSVLANLYRDGADSVSWHADDEPELGARPVIASVSLGEKRKFQLKHKRDRSLKYALMLPHGSVLMMTGETQRHWLHQIPKSQRPLMPRINLTFRIIQ